MKTYWSMDFYLNNMQMAHFLRRSTCVAYRHTYLTTTISLVLSLLLLDHIQPTKMCSIDADVQFKEKNNFTSIDNYLQAFVVQHASFQPKGCSR